MALRLKLALLLLVLTSLTIESKPTLNEETRNLCEGEENLAECLKEVEEAKKSVKDPVKPETKVKEEEDHYEMMMKQEAMIRKMVDENEHNRAYWDEEYKSINKWARYGIQ